MSAPVVVIGAELDGLLAALRLRELGHPVVLVARSAGSLHYAAGGVHLLGSVAHGSGRHSVATPMTDMAQLDARHPYALAGAERTRSAIDWAGAILSRCGIPANAPQGRNATAITPAGLKQPVFMPTENQATFEKIEGRRVAVVRFDGHRDLPAGLLLAALRGAGIDVQPVTVLSPSTSCDNLGIARGFDRQVDLVLWFTSIAAQMPAGIEVALFPAVLGLERHAEIVAAASDALGATVLEVPTLPPSVPGMRWARRLEHELSDSGCMFRRGVRIVSADRDGDSIRALIDENGRRIETAAVILATGGVLMGGLDVEADGSIRETALGLDVAQANPLTAGSPTEMLAALHVAGIETDSSLRPARNGAASRRNLFVTGRSLAHWHPAEEISAEGVSIVTGWLAAESAHEGMR
jgi:glycerol-3-phosphate dehydrogenase subunit B